LDVAANPRWLVSFATMTTIVPLDWNVSSRLVVAVKKR
jgi:hypothetical protein